MAILMEMWECELKKYYNSHGEFLENYGILIINLIMILDALI